MTDERLPNCPNPKTFPAEDRYGNAYTAVVCDCPRPDPRASTWRVHWKHDDGRDMHCPCGPHKPRNAPDDSTDYMVTMSGGYACRSCARTLPGSSLVRLVEVDMFCCYCDGFAERHSGYLLSHHPRPIGQ